MKQLASVQVTLIDYGVATFLQRTALIGSQVGGMIRCVRMCSEAGWLAMPCKHEVRTSKVGDADVHDSALQHLGMNPVLPMPLARNSSCRSKLAAPRVQTHG